MLASSLQTQTLDGNVVKFYYLMLLHVQEDLFSTYHLLLWYFK